MWHKIIIIIIIIIMPSTQYVNHHPVPLSRNLGALTFWKPLDLSRPVIGLIYLFTQYVKYHI